MENKTVGSRLDAAMQARGIRTQMSLARLSGVPQPTIARILKGAGKQGPETETLRALSKALVVHLRWLQEGVGPRDLSEPPTSAYAGVAEEIAQGYTSLVALEVAQATNELFRRATEILDTYSLASPTDRERIDLVIREIRRNMGHETKARSI